MVKYFITGVGGFVASHLVDYLLEKGEEVIGSYRWNEDLSRIKDIKDKITMVPMDLNDLSSCIKAIEEHKPDVIFHLAAQSYVGDSYDYPIETINTNTLGTVKLLEAVRIVRDNIKESGDAWYRRTNEKYSEFNPIIHVCSSSEVYGLVTEEEVPIKETCRFNPSNPYAVGKVGADMAALLYYTNYGLKTIRTRFFTHTGPRRTMMSAECAFAKQIAEFEKKWDKHIKEQKSEYYFNPDIVSIGDPICEYCRRRISCAGSTPRHPCECKDKKFILKHGNLDSVRTFADVRDAVKGYYILSQKGVPGEVYNIGGEHTCAIGEMLQTLISLSPIKDKIKLEQDPKLMRPFDVTLQIPDITKFKALGWKPEIEFEKTMKDLLDFWRQNV